MASLSISPQHAPPPYPSSTSTSTSTSPSKTYAYQYDCSLGRCTFNCPEWCILPPPPPLFLNGDTDDSSSSSSSRISPLMAALIAVLAAAFLLLFYFTVLSKLCRNRNRRRRRNQNLNPNSPFLDSSGPISARVDSLIHDPARTGLDDNFIRQITVFKYIKEDKLIDGTECAVCLNEFNEGENLRLMPNCEHAFHIPCIDTWLKTHSNCPLCRSTMNPVVPPPPTIGPGSNPNNNNINDINNNSNISVAALRIERRSNDVVLEVREVDNNIVQVVEPVGSEVRSGNLDERESKLQVNNNGNNIT